MTSMTSMRVNMAMRTLLIVGGLIHLAFGLGFNRKFASNKILSLIIGICAVSLGFNRDYFLPFLGQTVMPYIKESNELMLAQEKTSVQLTGLHPNSLIIFWAATPGKEVISDPFSAYGDYANAGITKSDAVGNAILNLKCPAQYKVRNKKLPKHVHYRVEDPKIKGLFSRVYTKKMEC